MDFSEQRLHQAYGWHVEFSRGGGGVSREWNPTACKAYADSVCTRKRVPVDISSVCEVLRALIVTVR